MLDPSQPDFFRNLYKILDKEEIPQEQHIELKKLFSQTTTIAGYSYLSTMLLQNSQPFCIIAWHKITAIAKLSANNSFSIQNGLESALIKQALHNKNYTAFNAFINSGAYISALPEKMPKDQRKLFDNLGYKRTVLSAIVNYIFHPSFTSHILDQSTYNVLKIMVGKKARENTNEKEYLLYGSVLDVLDTYYNSKGKATFNKIVHEIKALYKLYSPSTNTEAIELDSISKVLNFIAGFKLFYNENILHILAKYSPSTEAQKTLMARIVRSLIKEYKIDINVRAEYNIYIPNVYVYNNFPIAVAFAHCNNVMLNILLKEKNINLEFLTAEVGKGLLSLTAMPSCNVETLDIMQKLMEAQAEEKHNNESCYEIYTYIVCGAAILCIGGVAYCLVRSNDVGGICSR